MEREWRLRPPFSFRGHDPEFRTAGCRSNYAGGVFRFNSSGSFAMFAAMRRASSRAVLFSRVQVELAKLGWRVRFAVFG